MTVGGLDRAFSILSHERLEHMNTQDFIERGLLSGFKYIQTLSTDPDFPSFPLKKEHVEIETAEIEKG